MKPRLMFIGFAASMSVLLILFTAAKLMGY